MTFRRLVVVLAFALAATAAAECPENKYVVSDLVEGAVTCAQGRVELVCEAGGPCKGISTTNTANVDVAYGALKMTCTSKKVCAFTDALVGESTWGGHIDLECKGTQACWNSKFTSSSGKIVAVCQGGPKTCLATTFSSGQTMDITCGREDSCTRTHFAGGGHVSLTCKKPTACLDITLADDGTTCACTSATTNEACPDACIDFYPTLAPTSTPTAAATPVCPPCADVVTLDDLFSGTFDALEDNKCYVVDGTFPSSNIAVPDGVNCAKITVPSDSRLNGIVAHLPRPSFAPAPRETLRRGAHRSKARTSRSSTKARSTSSPRASRVRCFLLFCGPCSLRRAGTRLSCRNEDHEHRHQERRRAH